MTVQQLLSVSGASDLVSDGSIGLFIYDYAPYAAQSGILPLDSYYVACNSAYRRIKSANIGSVTNNVNIKGLLLASGFTQGRSGLILHPRFGSYFLVQAVLFESRMPVNRPDTPAPDCGSCTRCKLACPGGAIGKTPADFARSKCLRDMMDRVPDRCTVQFLGGELLGCEICRSVCPRNSWAAPQHMPEELSTLLELSVLLQYSPQTRRTISSYIGTNMARPSVLLPQAMAAAVRGRRTDLLHLIKPLLSYPSPRVSRSAALCIELLE